MDPTIVDLARTLVPDLESHKEAEGKSDSESFNKTPVMGGMR